VVDVTAYFERRLRRYGDSPKSLDWSEEGQRCRFRVLSEIGRMDNREVLDVGCGLGHYRDYLLETGVSVSYTGIDVSSRMIQAAKRRCPAVPFFVFDGTSKELPRRADFVVASGVLNVEDGNNEQAMRRLLRTCYSGSKSGTAVNMLSKWARRYDKDRHYYDPCRLLRFASTLSRRVVLRHDYLPHDFTLYLYR
jgi:trans-aconitate methyltransferase